MLLTKAWACMPEVALLMRSTAPMYALKPPSASLKGSPLGTGQTCIDTIDGCEPFAPFCRRTVHATLTLDLARGSLTVPMKLLEVLPTESSFIQLGSGMVTAGSGAYAVAKGRVAGGGAGAFDEQLTFAGRLVYTAQLTGVR